jgi:hypothetical protein
MEFLKRQFQFFFLSLILIYLSGCAALFSQRVPSSFVRPEGCQSLFDRLDEKVHQEAVKDTANFPIPGFPYLRTNRFLSALKEDLKDNPSWDQWVLWMQDLDIQARDKEIRNLSEQAVISLIPQEKKEPGRRALFDRVKSCSSELLYSDRSQANFLGVLQQRLNVPDEYSWAMRTIGLYPFAAVPVSIATISARQKARAWFNENLEDLPILGRLVAYVPAREFLLDGTEVRSILEESIKNPLGIPMPDKRHEKKLVDFFAPIFVQDVTASYDRIGQVFWKNGRVEIDPEKPTVYYYLSHAFLKGKPILQINYAIWFSERAGERSPWMERGHLDGLTLRVSLDGEGKPFMVDVVNDCGCYHFLAPQCDQVLKFLTKPFMFDPFVPQWLPDIPVGKRFGIRVNSGWHQVERVLAFEEPSSGTAYTLMDYDVLEALPHEEGRTESIFDSQGIVKGSERVERFILFPMGIPSIGSMRQRGHHAIELIGRAHFDDPRLFDRSFVFK